MVRVITVVFTIVLSYFFSKVDAQNSKAAPCSSPEYEQFDFWVGEWNVYNAKDVLIGNNVIEPMKNACTLQENWTSANGQSTGTSYSYYDISNKKWHQLWIDNKGYVLKTEGTFKNNKMTLSSAIVNGPNGKYYNRITWSKNNNGSVTQTWDFVTPEHKLIKQVFQGFYKKKSH